MLEYLKEAIVFLESYIVEMIKMYLLIRYILGGELRLEKKKWINVIHVVVVIEIVVVSALQIGDFQKNMILIITTIVYCMIRFKNIFLGTFAYLFFTFFDYGIGLFLIWLFRLDYQMAYQSDIFAVLVGSISLVVMVGTAVLKNRFSKRETYNIHQREIIFGNYLMFGGLLCIIPLATMIFQRKMGYLRGRVIIGMVLIVVIMFVCYQRYLHIRTEKELYKRELNLQQKMFEQQKEYYHLMLEKDREIKKFRHDFISHIRCISELEYKKKYVELHEYIDEMSSKVKEFKSVIATGNEIVNIVVNHIIQGKNIKLQWEGLCPPQLKMEQSEICVLFSNLLKNAVEATEKTEKKRIWVHIKEYEQHLVVEMINPVQDEVEVKRDKIETSKKDRENHGFGLENVSEIVRKYNGAMKYESKEEMFKVQVMLESVIVV